jgi:hypothetical protein
MHAIWGLIEKNKKKRIKSVIIKRIGRPVIKMEKIAKFRSPIN